MNNKKEIINNLEKAIDMADMPKIEFELKKLAVLSENQISPEDPALFSARVRALQKEKKIMKKSKKLLTIGIVAATLVFMSITIYASGILNRFSFAKNDTLTTVYSNEPITEEKAQELASNADQVVDPSQIVTADTQNLSFTSVPDAEMAMDMRLPLPLDMADFMLDSATGAIISFGKATENRTVWLDYSDKNSRMLGITVSKEIIADGETVTGITSHDMDLGSLGEYTTSDGIKYITLTESDPNNNANVANIATATIGEYEYTLVFFGFDQPQREEIINSVDLSVYK